MRFFNFEEEINKTTRFAVLGIPWDYLSSSELPNSSIAPNSIRNITNDIGYTTELGFHIPNFKAVDVGDVVIEPMNVEKNLAAIDNFIKELFNQNEKIIPIMIGGDHFCTYPMVKATADQIKKKEEFGVLLFDAHLDFYQEWDKGVYSHATISHRIYDLEYINNNNMLIVGARDIDIEELELANSENIKYVSAHHILEGIDYYIDYIKNFFHQSNIKNLYVSIDIDALDPSTAPGTGYAIAGGFSYREIWKILKEITLYFNVVGFDLVEVAPNLDLRNKMTSILAAKLIVEFMDFIRSGKL
ncbi:MAG: arginase family protein [Promethearchaeota archaeon]|jgi:agmatinase